MKEAVREAVNEQLDREFGSMYLYLSMAAYFESEDLEGFAHWMRMQADEEQTHAMKLYDYLVERGARVELGAIEEPESEWDSPLAAFRDALEHERSITESVNRVAETAAEAGDRATENVMDWFVDEQVEEESSVGNVVKRVEMAHEDPSALMMLDSELGERTATELGGDGEGQGQA